MRVSTMAKWLQRRYFARTDLKADASQTNHEHMQQRDLLHSGRLHKHTHDR